MRAFVCIGFAIIAALIILSVIAERCTACCNGEPCNPELRARATLQSISTGNP
jgi:hypothetical protein